MTNIVFQDIDGPLIPARILVQRNGLLQYDYHPTGTKKMDPHFIPILNNFCRAYNHKIVFNTAHNDFGPDYIYAHAEDNGFDMELVHEHFTTGYPTKYYKRIEAIEAWLREHPETKHWVVIDDYEIADGINHIRPSFTEGMTGDLINKLELIMMRGK